MDTKEIYKPPPLNDREWFSQVWGNFTLTIQIQQAMWNSIISFNGIIIAVITIAYTIGDKTGISWVVYGISLSVLSVVMIIINYRITFKVATKSISDVLRTPLDENGYQEQDPNYDKDIEKNNTEKKWVKTRENLSLIFSFFSVVCIFFIIFNG